jgi:hypothetical protein
MGMDVHGLNPKQNKKIDEFPIYKKIKDIEDSGNYNKRHELLDRDNDLREKYYAEWSEYEDANIGTYFRNNCWWWRPLWNYCYAVADDIISEEVFENGHSNSGAGLNDEDAKLLGRILLEQIKIGGTIQYQASYEQYLNDLPDDVCIFCNGNNRGKKKMKDCTRCNGTGKTTNFSKSYPFDIENVKRFAEFCIESGGFEIC